MAAKEGDRIIEIGCVELGEHGLTDKNFHEYIDPERQMEAEQEDIGWEENKKLGYCTHSRKSLVSNHSKYQVEW